MKPRTALRTGVIGFAAAAVCCFTPVLVIGLGAVGLSALVGWWLDALLFPALVVFLGLILWGLYRHRAERPETAR